MRKRVIGVLAAVGLTLGWCAVRPPSNLGHLGGGWYEASVRGGFNPDGLRSATLYRKTGLRYRKVADLSSVRNSTFFEPDCVVFRSIAPIRWELGLELPGLVDEATYVVLAVCGDRTPVPITMTSGEFLMDSSGFHAPEGLLAIERIRELALRQPRFRRGWRDDAFCGRSPSRETPLDPVGRPSPRTRDQTRLNATFS